MVSGILKESAKSPEVNRVDECFSILSGKMKETICFNDLSIFICIISYLRVLFSDGFLLNNGS